MNCLKWWFALTIVAAVLFAATADARDADQFPNIVFILTDDQAYGDLGCYGSTSIATLPADAGSLYNLAEDPGETTHVSDQQPEIVADLRRSMDQP